MRSLGCVQAEYLICCAYDSRSIQCKSPGERIAIQCPPRSLYIFIAPPSKGTFYSPDSWWLVIYLFHVAPFHFCSVCTMFSVIYCVGWDRNAENWKKCPLAWAVCREKKTSWLASRALFYDFASNKPALFSEFRLKVMIFLLCEVAI
jgi:hypothetical protein